MLPTNARGLAGFTLVESLIALTLAAIGASVIYAAVSSATKGLTAAREMREAAAFADALCVEAHLAKGATPGRRVVEAGALSGAIDMETAGLRTLHVKCTARLAGGRAVRVETYTLAPPESAP
jgi:prepilin-type N-terminal cleavage/methylation domain-containing protein